MTTPKTLPNISFESTGKLKIFTELRGKNVVLYFYPKDDTPGCTLEGIAFTGALKKFEQLNTVVLGVSRDSVKSHHSFCEKHSLGLILISDEDATLCKLFGVLKDKNMYGKTVQGIERSTFLFDTTGALVDEWRGVKVEGHVDEVLAKLSHKRL